MVDLTEAGKNYKIESKMPKIAKNRRAPQRRCGACGDGRGHATPRVGRREFQATQHLEPTPRARDGGPAQKARKGYYNVKYDNGDSESRTCPRRAWRSCSPPKKTPSCVRPAKTKAQAQSAKHRSPGAATTAKRSSARAEGQERREGASDVCVKCV